MHGLASLRCGDPALLRQIAAGGGPTRPNDWLHVGCPVCGCTLSGDPFTPNTRTDWCDDGACLCHREDA